jgi:hypothetical protein
VYAGFMLAGAGHQAVVENRVGIQILVKSVLGKIFHCFHVALNNGCGKSFKCSAHCDSSFHMEE